MTSAAPNAQSACVHKCVRAEREYRLEGSTCQLSRIRPLAYLNAACHPTPLLAWCCLVVRHSCPDHLKIKVSIVVFSGNYQWVDNQLLSELRTGKCFIVHSGESLSCCKTERTQTGSTRQSVHCHPETDPGSSGPGLWESSCPHHWVPSLFKHRSNTYACMYINRLSKCKPNIFKLPCKVTKPPLTLPLPSDTHICPNLSERQQALFWDTPFY